MRAAVVLEQCWHRVPGGTARAALETVDALVALNEVDLVGVSARHHEPPTTGYEPSIEVRQLPLPRLALYEMWHRIRMPRVQRATGPVDVIHATGMAVPPPSAPLAITVHDLGFVHEPRNYTAHGVSFMERSLALTRRHAKVVLCSSRATLEDCVAERFDPDRLRLVPLGVHVIPASPDEVAAARRAHRLERPYVLFVGTLEPRKNLPVLLDAFARLDRDDLDIVLVGPVGWGDDLAPRIDALGARAHITGYVPAAELRALYAGAAVFCYPSLLEGFGLPVLEAMAQGTPVVTSTGTATEELVAGGAGIAVDPRDASAIAGALETVLDDADVADGLRAAGRIVAAEHTWERTARLTLGAYREAMA
jgi:glycosyltransferase involved in cell wall biosynthesis